MGRATEAGGRAERGAWTIVELLVVLAVVGAVLGLLLPAVLTARELSRRVECQNNLRQLGTGLQAFASLHEAFPPGAITGSDWTEAHRWLRLSPGPTHGWAVFLLPYLDRPDLIAGYDWNSDWRAVGNRAIREASLSLMTCPSTPGRERWDQSAALGGWRAVAGDYAADYGVDPDLPHPGLIDVASSRNPRGALGINEVNLLSRISDGLSHTLCLAEDAGRPRRYGPKRRLVGGSKTSGAGWADPLNTFITDGSPYDTGGGPPRCPLNCTNDNEIYSFHPGGAQVLLADGAVRFVGDGIEFRCLARLITRAGGEAAPELAGGP